MSILRNIPFEAQTTLFPKRLTFEPYVLTALLMLTTLFVLRKLLSDGANLSHLWLDRFRAYEALPYTDASRPSLIRDDLSLVCINLHAPSGIAALTFDKGPGRYGTHTV